MIVVYDKCTGAIAYTIEEATTYDRENLGENEDMIVTTDESIRTGTHKISGGVILRKTEQEITAETQARNQQEKRALKQLQSQEEDLLNRLVALEGRLAKLESKESGL